MTRPKQRVTTSERIDSWIEESAKYYSSICIPAIDPNKADVLYRAANGELDEQSYTYTTNKFNSTNPKYTRYPSKMRNMDIISGILMMLMGEKRKRGLQYSVVPINSNIETLKKQMEDELAERYLMQEFINEYIEQSMEAGIEPEMEKIQELSIEQIKKKVSGLQDKVAVMGQAALDYIVAFEDINSKFIEGFYHWIVTGRVFSYKEPFRGEVNYEPVSPKEIRYSAHNRIRQLEDCEAVVRRVEMPISEVLDKFQGIKGFSKIESQLENRIDLGGHGDAGFTKHIGYSEHPMRAFQALIDKIRPGESSVYNNHDTIQVEHVVWTTGVKVGKLTTTSIFGELIEEEVDDTFKPRSGERVDWEWKEQKFHAYIIDDKHVVGGELLPYTETDGNRHCKNPYNGKLLNMKHTNPMSIVEKGIDYQAKYNVVHYYIEKLFAKNLDKIITLPISLLPTDKNLDMEASMYFADALGFLWVDDSKKNFATAIQGIKILDASLGQHISRLYEYLMVIKQDWESSIGVTAPRKGQMNASDGKGTTESAVFRSSIMTEEYFAQFEEFEERDLQGLLELSKIAFAEGKSAMFKRGDDIANIILEIDPEPFSYAKFQCKVVNSGKNLEELEMLKAQAQALTQNKNGRFSDVIKVIRGNNTSQLLEQMQTIEDNFEKSQQAAMEAQRAHETEIEDKRFRIAQLNYQANIYKADKSYDAQVEVAAMNNEARLSSDFFNATGASEEISKMEANSLKRQEIASKDANEKLRIASENEKSKRDAETKKYVADRQFQIAKENK